MGKKRKLTPVSRNRFDSKEEKSPLGDDVVAARDHLTGILQGLIDHNEDSSECSHDETSATLEGYSKSQNLLLSPKKEGSQISLGSSLSSGIHHRGQRKRRRRGEVTVGDAAYHHTYVMKLFDRSVDLAQFREDTPLYPVCRAWMANQPRNTSLAITRERTPTPEPPEESAVANNSVVTGDDGTERRDSLPAAMQNGGGEGKDMYKLPAPSPIPPGKSQRDLRMPSPIPYDKDPDFDNLEKYLNIQKDGAVKIEGVSCPPTEKLLSKHLNHWVRVRRKWQKAAQENENRYSESKVILQGMFKRWGHQG
ncbi:protein lin-37 homolog [Ischnura elegans]|uniref:protein lin-37 homolog n=1 Tax=Ischnura elegans TaxID=197161 RepID=UPI001ED87F16|nr:protein lin-37 homolog [Ischnura elegans]